MSSLSCWTVFGENADGVCSTSTPLSYAHRGYGVRQSTAHPTVQVDKPKMNPLEEDTSLKDSVITDVTAPPRGAPGMKVKPPPPSSQGGVVPSTE